MVGALGETELAAVTMANTLFFVLMLLNFGVMSGTSVLVAQYNGRGDKRAINRIMGVGLYMSIIATLIVSIIAALFPTQIMGVLTNNADLIEPGAEYMRIVGFSYVFMGMSGVYIAVMRSMENTKLGAYVLVASGAMNVLLNYMFIFGNFGAPELGCAGAALATLLSRMFEAVIVYIYAFRSKLLTLELKLILRPGKIIVGDFIRFSLPVMINEALWGTAVSIYSIIMGHMDNSTPILAAYTISSNIERLVSMALFASANATGVLVGKEIGKGSSVETIRSRSAALNVMCVATGILSAAALMLVRQFALDGFIFPLMNISPEAAEISKYMLLVLAMGLPIRAFNMCNIVGVFRSGGDVTYSLICDVVPMFLICVPVVGISALVFMQSITLVYLFRFLDEVVKIVMCAARLKSGKWVNNITREIL